MRRIKSAVSVLLAVVLLVGLLPLQASAATVAYVVRNGSATAYSDAAAAWSDAVSQNATFRLNADWYGNRRVVTSGCSLTVELNGHILGRDLSKWKSDGEVITVEDNASLTVYGGTAAVPSTGSGLSHTVQVYVPSENESSGFVRTNRTLRGGLITGGNSSNGPGGIRMGEKAKVSLYDTTLAGNRAEQNWGTDGYGGGVMMEKQYGSLFLDHSSICYNYAYNDGGGVHVDAAHCEIQMVMSHIDFNVANDNGGGVRVNGEYFRLRGDAAQAAAPEAVLDWNAAGLGSSVSYNYVCDSDNVNGGGGGLYLWNDTALVSGINFVGNIADKGGDGGAIFILEEGVTVRNCNLVRNCADADGGGLYNNNDFNTVDSCTVYDNNARDTCGAGGGVYTESVNNITVSGASVIRGNRSGTYTADNLFLPGGGSSGTNAFLVPSLTEGADVHVRLGGSHSDQVSTKGAFREDQFSYDNSSTQHITWDRSSRYLKRVSGAKPTKQVVTFLPDSGKRTQTVAGGYTVNGTTYELIKGIVNYPSFPDSTADLENIFYYSDGFFADNPSVYDPHLATASMCLAGAAGYSNLYGTAGADGYLDKTKNFRQFVSDLGCKDEDIFVNDFNLQKPGADTIGVGIASKPLFDGKTLVIIGVRGMGYEAEWISNMTLGAADEAQGWASAASQIMAELRAYLERKGLDGTSGNTVFWIAGYSRAGATANLTAKRIVDAYDNGGTHTFAYPIEAPQGGNFSLLVPTNNYNCIHNIVNQNDIVTWVGTTEMGLYRYGIDHYVPGGAATVQPAPAPLYDNDAWDVGSTSYNAQRTAMLAQLKAVNSDIPFDDYYHLGTVSYISSTLFKNFGAKMIKETSGSNWTTTEDFIDGFFDFFQQYAFREYLPWDQSHTIPPREYFASYLVGGRTFQQAAGCAANMIFAKAPEDVDGLTACFSDLVTRLSTSEKLAIYTSLNEEGATYKMKSFVRSLWTKLTVLTDEEIAGGYHSIAEYLTADELSDLNVCFEALLIPLLNFAAMDYENNSQNLLGSLLYNIPRIISNHYPEVTHAWLRSYDSFYANDTVAVQMTSTVKTAPSAAAVQITGADGSERTVVPDGSVIEVAVDDEVRLVPADAADRNTGEAIYYRFTSGTPSAQGWHAFAEPFRLGELYADCASNGEFTLSVIAAHNGVKLPEAGITLRLAGTAWLSAPDASGGGQYTETNLCIGERMALEFCPPDSGNEYRFQTWNVYLYDQQTQTVGEAVGADRYLEYFGADFDANSPTTTVTNCKGVSARFVPVYEKTILEIGLYFDSSLSNADLPDNIYCWDCYNYDPDAWLAERVPLCWTYDATNLFYIGSFCFTLPEGENLAGEDRLTVDFNDSLLDDYMLDYCGLGAVRVSGQTAQISLRFASTEVGDTEGAYLESLPGRLEVFDLNQSVCLSTYRFYSDDDEITAPLIEDMEFVQWADGSTAPTAEITYQENMRAWYRPIVSAVEVTLDRPLAAGQTMPALECATVTITDVWRIDSAVLEWNRPDVTADYDTQYTARVTVDKTAVMGTNLATPGNGSVPLTGAFAFADTVAVTVRDASGDPIPVLNSVFSESADAVTLDLVFEKTERQRITGFAEISLSVPHGSTTADVLAVLPETAYAYLSDGRMVQIPVQWTDVDLINAAVLDALSIHAYGVCTGETYVLESGVSLTANVTVLAAPKTAAPLASLSSGDYTGLQQVALSADEGAAIRYALAVLEDGAPEPDPATLGYTDYTAPLTLNTYGKTVCLFAFATEAGRNDSDVVISRYRLTKPEVTRLEPRPAHILEDGNAECWYTADLQYYADADCTALLNYDADVCIPAFVRSVFQVAPNDDPVTACLDFAGESAYLYSGLELLGVQTVGGDGTQARVLTVADSRILRDATDYGYLFAAADADLTADRAPYRFSCKGTENDLQTGEPAFRYVTARIGGALLDPLMKTAFYVTLENGVDVVCTEAAVCAASLPGSAQTDSADDNITVLEVPVIVSHSITLGDEIGVNFYLNFGGTAANAAATFAWGEGAARQEAVGALTVYSGADVPAANYVVTCRIAAKHMTDDVRLTLTLNGKPVLTDAYSVARYAEDASALYAGDADLKALLCDMLAYGGAAQTFFGYNTDDLASAYIAQIDPNRTAPDAPARLANPTSVPSAADLAALGLRFEYATLLATSRTAIRLYFTEVSAGALNRIAASRILPGADPEPLTFHTKGSLVYLELSGIAAKDVFNACTVTLTAAGTTVTIGYSPADYYNRVMASDADSLKAVMAAMYNYSRAAAAYLNN